MQPESVLTCLCSSISTLAVNNNRFERQLCPSPTDLAAVLIVAAMEGAALLPCVDQMKYSLTVMIVKEHILECHLYHIGPCCCWQLSRLKSSSKLLGCIN